MNADEIKKRITDDLAERIESIVDECIEAEQDRIDEAQRAFVPTAKHLEVLDFYASRKVFFYEGGFEFDTVDELVDLGLLRHVTYMSEDGIKATFTGLLFLEVHDLLRRADGEK